jgi:hypothetical protein
VGRRRFTLTPPDPFEHELQIDCTTMLELVLAIDVQWTAVDHAHSLTEKIVIRGGREIPVGLVEAKKRKARGIRPGICDYLFWHRSRGYAIELKRDASSPLSDVQKVFCRGLIDAQIPVKICWTKDQVYNVVSDWGLTRLGVSLVHPQQPMRVVA